MKTSDFTNIAAESQLSVNDVVRNLIKLLAFKYKSHDTHFTRVAEDPRSQDANFIETGLKNRER